MEEHIVSLFHLAIPWWEFVVRCVAVDLVLVLLVANAVQPAMTGPDSSLAGGLIIIGVLVLFNYGLARADRFRLFQHLLMPSPRILIRNGAFVDAALRHEGVDKNECEMAIREHGVGDVNEVKLGVLESDGTISIVPRDAKTVHTRRVVRYVRHG
jgi:uncharacterized membrane protein YcaP (DUF421 family)